MALKQLNTLTRLLHYVPQLRPYILEGLLIPCQDLASMTQNMIQVNTGKLSSL